MYILPFFRVKDTGANQDGWQSPAAGGEVCKTLSEIIIDANSGQEEISFACQLLPQSNPCAASSSLAGTSAAKVDACEGVKLSGPAALNAVSHPPAPDITSVALTPQLHR